MKKQYGGNWTDLRKHLGAPEDEIDLHFGRRDPHTPYGNVTVEVAELVEKKLRQAQESGRPYVLFVHGRSTSRPGQTTARSVVRGFMRSSAATPLIERSGCIQHATAFLAKIRPKKQQ